MNEITLNEKSKLSDDVKLQVLIEQWKEINAFINKLDTETWIVFTILGSLYGIVITAFKGKLTPSGIEDARFWLLILLPIVSAAIIGSLANNFRWVAIARMYASSIENEINTLMKKDYYIWNLHLVGDYVENNNFLNSKLMPGIIMLFFAILVVYLSTFMIMSKHFQSWVKFIYIVLVIILYVLCAFPFTQNSKIRNNKICFDQNKKYICRANKSKMKR